MNEYTGSPRPRHYFQNSLKLISVPLKEGDPVTLQNGTHRPLGHVDIPAWTIGSVSTAVFQLAEAQKNVLGCGGSVLHGFWESHSGGSGGGGLGVGEESLGCM